MANGKCFVKNMCVVRKEGRVKMKSIFYLFFCHVSISEAKAHHHRLSLSMNMLKLEEPRRL